jgi:hypothetical protein
VRGSPKCALDPKSQDHRKNKQSRFRHNFESDDPSKLHKGWLDKQELAHRSHVEKKLHVQVPSRQNQKEPPTGTSQKECLLALAPSSAGPQEKKLHVQMPSRQNQKEYPAGTQQKEDSLEQSSPFTGTQQKERLAHDSFNRLIEKEKTLSTPNHHQDQHHSKPSPREPTKNRTFQRHRSGSSSQNLHLATAPAREAPRCRQGESRKSPKRGTLQCNHLW